ncbi:MULTISPECIES: hypothetical protein [unclassified Nostoc]|nr:MULTISPECIES: hypothetical protein [unclassified Nostoc]
MIHPSLQFDSNSLNFGIFLQRIFAELAPKHQMRSLLEIAIA